MTDPHPCSIKSKLTEFLIVIIIITVSQILVYHAIEKSQRITENNFHLDENQKICPSFATIKGLLVHKKAAPSAGNPANGTAFIVESLKFPPRFQVFPREP